MITRRSFFAKFTAIAAAIALAPEIAFGRRLSPFTPVQTLDLNQLFANVYAIMRARQGVGLQTPSPTLRALPGVWEQLKACE